jgi:hypothetical protein
MQRSSVFSIVGLLAVAFLAGRPATAAAQTSTVRCESQQASRVNCAIPFNARVALSRQLSDTPCRENSNWGANGNVLWVSGGCRADFTVTADAVQPSNPTGPGYGTAQASPFQLRVCRAEADRRLPQYTGNQIQVNPESRSGPVVTIRWRAGTSTGLCEVQNDGRLVSFTTDDGGKSPGEPGGTTRVTCESKRGDRQQCAVPAGSRIRLARQLSTNPCRPNETYGQASSYIWVDEGCRAEFEVTQPGDGAGPGGGAGGVTRITCESPNNAQRSCPFPSGSTVRLASQLSSQPCILNQTYGLSATYVWVTRGCGAVFEVHSGASGGNGGSYTTRMSCESQNDGRQVCPIAGASSVRLVRQISSAPCQLNRTFGMQFGGIWASNGCRGEFDVTVTGGSPGGAASGPGTGLPERITCASNGGERVECRFRQAGRVTLARQLSTTACVQNSTWGVGFGGTMWVTKGCRGEFESRP